MKPSVMYIAKRVVLAVGLWALMGTHVFAEVGASGVSVAQSGVVSKPSSSSAKVNRFRHPSFIAGIVLLSVGAATLITGGVLQGLDLTPAPADACVINPEIKDDSCVYHTYPVGPVLLGVGGGATLAGAGSMLYWGLKVNIP